MILLYLVGIAVFFEWFSNPTGTDYVRTSWGVSVSRFWQPKKNSFGEQFNFKKDKEGKAKETAQLGRKC